MLPAFLFTIATGAALAAAADPPAGCNVPSSYTMTNFSWFNSTHNLNCLEYQPESDYYTGGCMDANGNWCNPDDDGCDKCDVPLCSDGVPTQPFGYGPPDTIQATFVEGLSCRSANSAGSKSRNIGDGIVLCNNSPRHMQFFGNSNTRESMGRVSYTPPGTKCADNSTINPRYELQFGIICEHDDGNNATCTPAQGDVVVPLAGWYFGRHRG